MQFTALEVEIKSPDWKIVTAKGLDGVEIQDASINRTSKKGDMFPNFDLIVEGYTFEADFWRSDAGKAYLFAPKPKRASGGNFERNKVIKEAMEVKGEQIDKAQTRKQDGIRVAGAMRDATLVTLAALKDQPFPTDSEFKTEWTKWVQYFLGKHEEPFI